LNGVGQFGQRWSEDVAVVWRVPDPLQELCGRTWSQARLRFKTRGERLIVLAKLAKRRWMDTGDIYKNEKLLSYYLIVLRCGEIIIHHML
jgi:hypothetical protein